MKKSSKLVPAWAGEYCGHQVRPDGLDFLKMEQDVEVMEGNKDGEWLITFPTRLKCPCPMNESKGSVTLKIKAGKLAAIQTEFLAYVFRPPEVGWRSSGNPCALKDDDFAQDLVRKVVETGKKIMPKKVKKTIREPVYGFYAHSEATCLGGGEGEFRWFATVAEAGKELLDFSDTCGATDSLGDDEDADEDDLYADDRARFKKIRAKKKPNEDDIAYLAEFISSGDVENIAWYGWERDLLTESGGVPDAVRSWFRAKRDEDGDIVEPGSDGPIQPDEEVAFWAALDSGDFVLET